MTEQALDFSVGLCLSLIRPQSPHFATVRYQRMRQGRSPWNIRKLPQTLKAKQLMNTWLQTLNKDPSFLGLCWLHALANLNVTLLKKICSLFQTSAGTKRSQYCSGTRIFVSFTSQRLKTCPWMAWTSMSWMNTTIPLSSNILSPSEQIIREH